MSGANGSGYGVVVQQGGIVNLTGDTTIIDQAAALPSSESESHLGRVCSTWRDGKWLRENDNYRRHH